MKIINGDCIEVLKQLEENSVDSIVTDPPYELGFMGKSWDNTGIANNPLMWKECLRVLKPGGHLLSFGGTRTYHRMACAIEDAGFEVRDMVEWVYGSGFPKSLNIGKAVDKLQGNEREEVEHRFPDGSKPRKTQHIDFYTEQEGNIGKATYTKGTSEWEGWGTALKPAHEPIVWATKSLTNKNQFAIMEDINSNLISTIWQSLENLQKQDTFKLQETVLIHLNTALLWQNILVELLKNESKFTTSTASKMITELKILNSLLLKNTQDDTDGKSQTYQNGTQESQANGLDLLVGIVESCLAGEKKSIANIQTLIVQGLATYKQNRTGMTVKNVEQDLLPIILNANSVLISVLTDIITELSQNELSTFVSFAEKSLKQYLAEPQSIADENVWQEHIQKALPNHSPICMARKPLAEKTVAENVLKWGTGGINIDESRVETGENLGRQQYSKTSALKCSNYKDKFVDPSGGLGRFPANLIHDNSEEVRECFPESKSAGEYKKDKLNTFKPKNAMFALGYQTNAYAGETGSASRFFKSIIYTAKASKSERNRGCEELEEGEVVRQGLAGEHNNPTHKNNHPTVKPIALMEYLIKMVTPKGGIVLDQFSGSGSTLVAAKENGFDFIGIEKEPEYIKIIEARTGIKAEVAEIKEVVKVPEIKKEVEIKSGLSKCCNAKIIKGYCEKCCELVK